MTSTSAIDTASNAQRQTWIAAAAVILTVIGTVIGAAWWTGRQMATREDLTELRQEMTTHRQETSAALALFREELAADRQETSAALALIRQEIAADRQETSAAHTLIREEIASQMREIRGYIIDHLEEHPID